MVGAVFATGLIDTAPMAQFVPSPHVQPVATDAAPASVLPPPLALVPANKSHFSVCPASGTRSRLGSLTATTPKTSSPEAELTVADPLMSSPDADAKVPRGVV